METNNKRVAVIDGCRTPFLRSGTGFADTMAWELSRYVIKDIIAKTGIDSKTVDHVIMGNVASDISTTNVAREAALAASLPKEIPAHTCTVACISSNMAITNGVNAILAGNADTIIAGGVETFSDVDIKISAKYRRFLLNLTMFKKPKTLGAKLKLLKGMKLKDFVLPQTPAIAEFSTQLTMGQDADRLAKRMGITRTQQDEFAALSHQRAANAMENGWFKKQITPVILHGTSTPIVVDNGPRGDSTAEKLKKLRPAFDRKYGTVTAANASFLTDGASAVLLMSEEKAKALGLKPLAYIKSYAYSSQNPEDELLLGPAFSMPLALEKAGLTLSDMGVVEIHEAFASQVLANINGLDSDTFCREKLGLSKKVGEVDMGKLNLHGGSLSIGHPFGATGGRLITTTAHRMKQENAEFGIIAACAAGAIGNAIVLENAGN